ncbi:MAG: hypothetical protein FD170_3733 [Bacteroidetes bacterium]|nr:MAG: hypothetical protein FD170_3733 [Bacteroidota bacterium]
MEYTGYVVCDCYQKGKTLDPPHKEYVRFDKKGLHIYIPKEIMKQEKKVGSEMEADFYKWKTNACEHEDMVLEEEYFSNSWGWSDFRTFINDSGGKLKFPVLTKYLPKTCGGILRASRANEILKELALLEALRPVRERVTLIEIKSGDVLATSSSDEPLFMSTAYKHNFYLDRSGFFIVPNIYGKDRMKFELFRSVNFVQHSRGIGKYTYTDVSTGSSIECTHCLYPMRGLEPIVDYEFEIRYEPDYDWVHDIINSLKILAEASVKTGNPVHWC